MPPNLKRTNSARGSPELEPLESQKFKKRQIEEESDQSESEEGGSNFASDIEEDEVGSSSEPRHRKPVRGLDDINFDDMQIHLAGTIARVELVNFMCHKFLKVDLGPKINFVIGHNGSGKSAILTAITLALGANASATNRGKNASSFIKEGSTVANITIHLTNGGDSAYRPELYPDMIIVERRLNKDGPSPYKIKNSSGKVVSTKKEDLIAILDHLNLLVNNPLTMLTQDMARKFLSDSTAEDKYKLFMHGTQLTSLQKDLESVREQLESSAQLLERKKQALPILQNEADEAQRKFKDIRKARDFEDQIELLNNELVWSQIITKEKDRDRFERDANQAQAQLSEFQEQYREQKRQTSELSETIVSVQEEMEVYRNRPNEHKEENKKALEEKTRIDVNIKELNDTLKEINNDVKEVTSKKKKVEEHLIREETKLEANSKIKRDEILGEIKKAEEELSRINPKVAKCRNEYSELEKNINTEQENRRNIEIKTSEIRRRRNELKDRIQSLEATRGDHMRAFGRRMPEVVEAVRKDTRWKKRTPVGPFGSYLKLKHPKYAKTLESVLKNVLNAFVVECFEDRQLLFSILSRFDMRYIPIFVCKYELFDYSQGEPDPKYLTTLRALEFKDDWVKCQMIISNKIEKTMLSDDRQEADRIMYSNPRNIDLCFTNNGYKVGGKSGMRTESIDIYTGPPRFQSDVQDEIRSIREEGSKLGEEFESLSKEHKDISIKITELKKRQQETKKMELHIEREISTLQRVMREKEATLHEEDPVDLNMYRDDIKEFEEKIRNYQSQFLGIQAQKKELIVEIGEWKTKIKHFEYIESRKDAEIEEYIKKIRKMEDRKQTLQRTLDKLKQQEQAMRTRYDSKHASFIEATNLVEAWIRESSEDYPDRVDTNRTPQEIDIDLEHLKKAVEEMSREHGSLQELEEETLATVARWDNAQRVVTGMEKLNKSLQKMLVRRIEKWEAFRNYIALAAKNFFSFYLHLRGDEGTLRFNHEHKRLEIRVSTGDQYSKGSRQKDSRSLSGGEKSFSQISLLLSLWQSITSPIICLDEFDVFMDAVNRKQTMNMIMNAASDNSSQYILITPQDASNMEPGKYVTVHRLADPDRN